MVDTTDTESKGITKKVSRKPPVIHVPEGADWNPVEEAILRRRSIRKFKRKQVPEHIIRRVLEAGRFAPSQGNCQPWKYIVVRDAKMIAEMEESVKNTCVKLSKMLVYTNYKKGSLRRGIAKLMAAIFNRFDPNTFHPIPVSALKSIADGRFSIFHKSPTLILLLVDRRAVGTPSIDIGITGTNMILTAQSMGLGTCWVGFIKMLDKKMKKKLGVEEPYDLVEAISIGYPVGYPSQQHISRETQDIDWWENGEKKVIT